MTQTIKREFSWGFWIFALLMLSLPFLPSYMLVQPGVLIINGERASMIRTVTTPVTVEFFMEFETAEGVGLPACNIEDKFIAEYRGRKPFVFDHNCAGLVNGEAYIANACYTAIGPLGIHLRPTCYEPLSFVAGVPALVEQLNRLEESEG